MLECSCKLKKLGGELMKTLNEQQLKTVNGGGTCAPDGEDSFMCDVGQGAKKAWNWIRNKF